jgi:hypothetical protein
VAAAEHQRARTVKCFEQGDAGRRNRSAQERQRYQQYKECGQRNDSCGARDGYVNVTRWRCWGIPRQPEARNSTKSDRAYLRHGRRAEEDDQRRSRRFRGPLSIGTERTCHAPDGLCDNGNSDELETVQQANAGRAAERAISEEDKRKR